MTQLERRLVAFILIFSILTLSVVAVRGMAPQGFAQVPTAYASDTYYGANSNWVATAASEWPQKEGNWCGPANIEVVANYTFQMLGGQNDTPFLSGGQQRIVNDLNSPAGVSEWGTPSWNGIGPGFKADIARDGGLDPRGMAWGIYYESFAGLSLRFPPGPQPPSYAVADYAYHDVIYHNDVTHAVGGLARTLERFHQPISVTIAHGLHFDVVSGVYASDDPINSYPARVDAVTAWDPAVGTSSGGYQSAREVTWTGYTFNTNSNMWGTTYQSNNGYDPDPLVGIYVPNSTYKSHWIGNRTDFEPDMLFGVGVDFALDENGNVMTHP
ncbi:MAG: hypothetical protein ACHQ4H_09550 [Ktedonobacterales bacterium]